MKLSSQLSLVNHLSTVSRDGTRHPETCYQKGFGGFTHDSLESFILVSFLPPTPPPPSHPLSRN